MWANKQTSPSSNSVKTGNEFFFNGKVIQPKLQINEPGDSNEKEADHMADSVMSMTDNSLNPSSFFKPANNNIQRKTHQYEEDDLHRKENDDTPVTGSEQLNNYVSSLSSSGQPLTAGSRQFFEPRFGRNFSNVRLHTGSLAAKSAQSINALAYTTGNNIVFDHGQYSPETSTGQRLIAHELTHVVQQSNTASSINIQRDKNPNTHDNTTATDPDTVNDLPIPKKDTVTELQYAFIFDNGPYGQSAELFIKKYNPDHIIIKGSSFENMVDRLYADVQKNQAGNVNHIKEIIIVTHANAAGGMKIPLTSSDTKTKHFFTPWDLADLQKNFKDGLFKTFNKERASLVTGAIDKDTTVVVRGCNFGQSQEAMDALRIFFGGQPTVFAPTVFQGYEASRINKNNFLSSAEKAFDFLVDQGFLPPELSPAPDVDKKAFMKSQFSNQIVPDEFFVDDQEKHDDLNKEIGAGKGLSEEAEKDKDRDGSVNIPGGKNWGSSSASALGSDAELDGLSQKELEDRASALINPYKPQNAAMLLRLRDAWTRVGLKTFDFKNPNPDPLYGLPPEGIFGDSNLLAGDASKYPMRTPHDDEFMTGTLPSLKDTAAEKLETSKTFDDEIGDADKANPAIAAPLNIPGLANKPGQTSFGQSPDGKKRGLGQEMSDLKSLGGDFSKKAPEPVPVPIPDPAQPEPVTDTTNMPKGTPFSMPGITRFFSRSESIALEVLLNINPTLGPLIDSALILTETTDTTVGIGIQLSANAVAGVSPGAGIVIHGGRIVGLYGAIAGNAGFTIGLSAEIQVTIEKGGLENFSGESISMTGGGGELLVGHGSIIVNTKGEFLGISVSGGVGAGITAIEGYMSYQNTYTPDK